MSKPNEQIDEFKWKREGFQDDGTLKCLGLGTDRVSKSFSCPVENQSRLNGQTFVLVDAFVDLELGGKEKALFKMKPDFDSPEEAERKVWTGSPECIRILRVLIEHNLFPRKVKLVSGKRGAFHFE